MRTLLSSLYASLGINALFAVLTLVFLHSWDRPLLVLIVSAFYLFAAKRLRNGERGLYKRVRMVSSVSAGCCSRARTRSGCGRSRCCSSSRWPSSWSP
jgi:hypothetical protein